MKRFLMLVVLVLAFPGRHEFVQGQDPEVLRPNTVVHKQEASIYLARALTFLTVHNPLGVEIELANQALRKQLKLEENQGLVIVSVPDESEGGKIGLKAFDVLISLDQHQISSGDQLQSALKTLADKQVTILLMREGKLVTLNAKLPTFETVDYDFIYDPAAKDEGENQTAPQSPYRIGVMLKELEPALRAHLKLETEGLLISEVVPDSPAAAAGIQVNDVVVRCNNQPVATTERLNQTIQEIKSNPARLSLIRSGDPIEVEVIPQLEAAKSEEYQLNFDLSRIQPTVLLHPIDRTLIDDWGVKIHYDLDVKFEPQAELEPFQTEFDALQTALDDLKSRIKQSKDVEARLHVDAAQASSEAQPSIEAQAIERVLAVDRVLGKQRNYMSQSAGLSLAVNSYVAGLDAIDYSGTPPAFRFAIQTHRDAWHNAIEFLKQHDSLRGEMHELFDQIRALNPQQKEQLDSHNQKIMDTWSEVEKAAKAGK